MVDSDQEIRTRFTADTGQYIERVGELRAETQRVKEEIRSMGAQGEESYRLLAQAMKDSYEQQRMAAVPMIGNELTGFTYDPEGLAQAKDDIKLYKEAVTIAFAEMTQSDKTYSDDYKVNRKNEIAAQNEFLAAIKSGNMVMSDAAKIQGEKLQSIAAKIREIATTSNISFRQAGEQLVKTGTPINEVNGALQLLTTKSGTASSALAVLGKTALSVLAPFISLVAILRSIVNFFVGAAKAGMEFTKSIYQLSIGVRALQRSGVDTTIGAFVKNIQALKAEFQGISEVELYKGSATMANLLRDMQLTEKQIFSMQRAAVTLAIVNGRTIDEVQKTLALAMSSGYTEGLQRLGVSINRVTIAMKAAELGWKGGYNALTEHQRAVATEMLIEEKMVSYAKDVQTYYDTAPGQVSKLSAAWKDFNKTVGTFTTPILAALASGISLVIQILEVMLKDLANTDAWRSFQSNIAKTVVGFKMLSEEIASAAGGHIMTDEEKLTRALEIYNNFLHGLKDTDVILRAQTEFNEEMTDKVTKFGDDLIELEKDMLDKRGDIWIDFYRDMLDIDRNGQRRREELAREHARRLEKIDIDLTRDIAEAHRDYEFDLSELTRDTNEKIAEAQRKYREDELKDERDFQEKLRQLRENFLLDVEDAVRERDARQYLKSLRAYNLRKSQMLREHEQDGADREEALRREIEDIRRQDARKRKEMAIAFQQKLADLRLQAEQQKAEEE
ncbi:MAG: hypothetical protein KKH61_20775, partial [Gammaproteobacteria bacterium]|nr:hypothetical protein [Gammaproteobacteria bacterium]